MDPYAHLKTSTERKEEGNRAFRAGRFAEAVTKYKAALRKKDAAPLRAALHCNVCVCLARLERWEDAIAAATDCLGAGADSGRPAGLSLKSPQWADRHASVAETTPCRPG